MGNWLFKEPEKRVIIQGLDASGKTSLLYRLKLGEVVRTIPTVGFNVETVLTASGVTLMCWDLGGRDKVRPLYRHYYPNTHGYVYVVDCADRERLNQALEELVQYILLEDLTRGSVVMVLANKQDLPDALTAGEVEVALAGMYNFDVRSPGLKHTVFVRPCSVATAEGLDQAFYDFTEQLRLKQTGKSTSGLLALEDSEKHTSAEDTRKNAEGERGVKNSLGNDKQGELTAPHEIKTINRNPFSLLRSLFSS